MLEAERNVIGSILLDSSVLYKIYNKLKPEMFTNEFYRDTYFELLAMYDLGENINCIELSNRLESPQRNKEYIFAALKECINSTPTSVIVESAAKELINEYKTNKVKGLFASMKFIPNDVDKDIGYLLAELEALNNNRESTCRSMKQIVEENKGNYFIEKDERGIKTGFYKLDDILGVLEGGDVTVIGARPAVGKSALVTQIIGQVAKKGHRVGYFNLEMRENQVYERFVSRMSKIGLTRVRRAKSFLRGEEEQFNKANDELAEQDIVISTGSKSVSEIKAEARHQRFDLIVIDYLQLIKADRKYANRASEVGDISKAIKGLAMELNVPIILLSQLNRASEGRETKEPDMSELRESGDIEQDASNIILIWNLSEDIKRAKGVKVAKCRQSEPSKIGMEFNGDMMEFIERDESFERYLNFIKNAEKNGFKQTDETPFNGGGW